MFQGNNNMLPPGMKEPKKQGVLEITAVSISFSNNMVQNALLKIGLWGCANPYYVEVGSIVAFDVVSNVVAFKQYLIDSKVVQLQVVDRRNYKSMANGVLSWVPYLRAITDNQMLGNDQRNGEFSREVSRGYYLPFFDEEMQVNVELRNLVRNPKSKELQKVGELLLKWRCRVYNVSQAMDKGLSRMNSEGSFVNIRMSEIKSKLDVNPVSIADIQLASEDPQSQWNDVSRTNRSLLGIQGVNSRLPSDNILLRKSNISIKDNFSNMRHLKKVREEDSSSDGRYTNKVHHVKNVNNLDAELMRIRMEMDEFVEREREMLLTVEMEYVQVLDKRVSAKNIMYVEVVCQRKSGPSKYRLFVKNVINSRAVLSSYIAIERGNRMSATVVIKSAKERVIRGETVMRFIGDEHDMNLVNNEGIIQGTLRFKVMDQADKVIGKRQVKQEKGEHKPESMGFAKKQKQLRMNEYQSDKKRCANDDSLMKRDIGQKQGGLANKQRYDAKQVFGLKDKGKMQMKGQNLYLYICFNENDTGESFAYRVFDRQILESCRQKFVICGYEQILAKELVVGLYRDGLFCCEQKISKSIPEIEYIKNNLTCMLLVERRIAKFNVVCQVYCGSLLQISYLVQQLAHSSKLTTRGNQQMAKQFTIVRGAKEEEFREGVNKQELGGKVQLGRKMKTEEGGRELRERMMTQGRVSGESATANQLQIHQQQGQMGNQSNQLQNENVYLVDLLTKFLSGISEQNLPSRSNITKVQFMQELGKGCHTLGLSSQLKEVISEIFKEEEEVLINIDQIRQSCKSLKTFADLYRAEKEKLLEEVMRGEPRAAERIQNSAELGMINQSILWGRALKKVQGGDTRKRINRFYRISSYGPTDARYLVQDLLGRGKKQLSGLDISNVGILIREFVQRYLQGRTKGELLGVRGRLCELDGEQNCVNIRGLNLLFESQLDLKISLWQSLMLIEQIKVTYGCDLQVDEGIITGESLVAWVDSIQRRRSLDVELNVNQSKMSLDQQEMALFQRINNQNREKMLKQSLEKSRVQSEARVQNNDSEITDIANLLRRREEEFESKTEIVVNRDNKQNRSSVNELVNNELLFEKQKQSTERVDIHEQNALVGKKKVPEQAKIYMQIKSIKLYQQFKDQQRTKVVVGSEFGFGVGNNFFYLEDGEIDSRLNYHLFEMDINRKRRDAILIKFLKEDLAVGNAVVPWEQFYQELQAKKSVVKSALIYDKKGKILGKLSMQLTTENKLKKGNLDIRKSECLLLTVDSIGSMTFRDQLYLSVNGSEARLVEVGRSMRVQLLQPIYCSEVVLFDRSEQFECVVSLQELFVRHRLMAEYPLVSRLTGKFAGNIKISMSIEGGRSMLQFQGSVLQKVDSRQGDDVSSEVMLYLLKQVFVFGKGVDRRYQFSLECRGIDSYGKESLMKGSSVYRVVKRKIFEGVGLSSEFMQIERENQATLMKFVLMQNAEVIAESQVIKVAKIDPSFCDVYVAMSSLKEKEACFCLRIKKLVISKFRGVSNDFYGKLCSLENEELEKGLNRAINQLKRSDAIDVEMMEELKKVVLRNKQIEQGLKIQVNGQRIVKMNVKHVFLGSRISFPIEQFLRNILQCDVEDHGKLQGSIQFGKLLKILNRFEIKRQRYLVNLLVCLKQASVLSMLQSVIVADRITQGESMGYCSLCHILLQMCNYKKQGRDLKRESIINQINQIYNDLKVKLK